MKRYVHKLLSEVLGNMYENGQIFSMPSFVLEAPKEEFGDFSTNVAFEIARSGKYNPNEVANIIGREIKELDKNGIIKEIKIIGGFINIFIAEKHIADFALQMQKEIDIEKIGFKSSGKPQKVIFEYSSPNTNKPLHIGHARNDFYGMACIRLLRETGHEVIACEVINDRGVHIMKSMLMYMKFGNAQTPQSEKIKPDHFVGKFYAMFAEKSEEDPALNEEVQQLLQKWEAGDEQVRKIWKQMNDWFFEGVKQTYEKEGSVFDEVQYESDIYDKGRDLVLEGVKKGVFQKEEDGSVSVDLTEQGLDKKYLLRKDGTTLYITQDFYLWFLRNEKHKPDLAIVTTAAEQAYHFNVLSHLFRLIAFRWAESFKHLPYEHVYLGKSKMSSRAGNSISSDELLAEVKERVRQTMKASQKIKASADDQETVEKIAFAAIKYGYLKYDRNTKIYFDMDETIAIEGNTGPYLQYVYARIQSILKKAGNFDAKAPENLKEESEISLLRFLMHYDPAVVAAAREYKPNTLGNYLFELASKFNKFYDQVSILEAESEQLKMQRLNLITAVAKVLEHGLKLLGIEVLNEM
jgi:arginyl-tRNA synthetase